MGENICKGHDQQGVNIQNIQTVHTTQYQKNPNNPIKKRQKGFPGGAVVKNLPANAEDTGLSPGPGRSHMPRSN